MMSSNPITAATIPMIVPPYAFEGVLRGGVVVAHGIRSCTRWTRGGAASPALASFTTGGFATAGAKQDHCSRDDNGGGLRTRVEVTDRS